MTGTEEHEGAPRSSDEPRAARWMLAAMLGPVLVYVLVLTWRDPGPSWRAEYYANEKLAGAPVVRQERSPRINVRYDAPVPGLNTKRFSARWQTCLHMDRAGDVVLQISSDDGSRLFVDGAPVVDIWGVHEQTSRGGVVRLTEGTHHLRLEYHQDGGAAALGLNASFAGEAPGPIPDRRLRYPSNDGRDCS